MTLDARNQSRGCIMAASIAHAMPAAKMGTTSFLCATMAKRRETGAHKADRWRC